MNNGRVNELKVCVMGGLVVCPVIGAYWERSD